MIGPDASRAIESALRHGRALLKVISPNDVGNTGSHQSGFLLPVPYWRFYSPLSPEDAPDILKHPVSVVWPDGTATDSVITWYRSKHEFRLTRFGPGFSFRRPEDAGGVLVLVEVETLTRFEAFVLSTEEEIEELQAVLGVELIGASAIFDRGVEEPPETEDECLARQFREVLRELEEFPTTFRMSELAQQALSACVQGIAGLDSDKRLMRALVAEYELFRRVEHQLCTRQVTRAFLSIDEFLEAAQTILQRRKARAGKSLENHFYSLLEEAAIPFEKQVRLEASSVDALIPGRAEYFDDAFPRDRIFTVAVKTTCRDRWRQILPEATRVRIHHLLTVQKGISQAQILEMVGSGVQLVVPRELHREYPGEARPELLTVERFLEAVVRATR